MWAMIVFICRLLTNFSNRNSVPTFKCNVISENSEKLIFFNLKKKKKHWKKNVVVSIFSNLLLRLGLHKNSYRDLKFSKNSNITTF